MRARKWYLTSYVSRFSLLAILLLACLLRFYRLDSQSLWNDEGNSARIAERSFDLILEGAAGDIHPPGYYLLLHYWRAVSGHGEFALRSLSVVAGVALVAFTYLLGRCLFDETTGLMAALLGAISPFAVYYSQEARMYALLAALSAASGYLVARGLRSGIRRPQLLAYALICAAGLYTHYVFVFVLIAHNVVFGTWWLARWPDRRWRQLLSWAGAQAAAIALYVPWLPTAVRGATGWSSAGGGRELGSALLNILRVLTVGVTQRSEEAEAALIGAGLLLLAGSWPLQSVTEDSGRSNRLRWPSIAGAVLYLLLPVALFLAFDLHKPAWLKFLVVALPPFHVLLARGVDNVVCLLSHVLHSARYVPHISYTVLRILLLATLIVMMLPSLSNLYFNLTYARDDYRQLAADIQAVRRPGDAIILNAPNQWEVFTYYYPDRDVHPAPYRPTQEEVEAFLTPLLKRYDRLFVLYWGDPESDPRRLIETRLAGHAYKTSDRWYGDVRLATYGLASRPEQPDVTLDARFGGAVRLQGYALGEKAQGALNPGDIVPVTLFWEARGSIADPYKVTVQVLKGGKRLVAQFDTVPCDGLAPTTSWQLGRTLTDRYGVQLPPDAPSGRYSLIVALYHAASGARLPVMVEGRPAGDHLVLDSIFIRSR